MATDSNTTNPSVQPNRWLLSTDLTSIRGAVARLESQMLGFHFTGTAAEDIQQLARRLADLCEPGKGHLKDGAKAAPLKDAA